MKLAWRHALPLLGMLVAGTLTAQTDAVGPEPRIITVAHGTGGLSMTDGAATASVTLGAATIGRIGQGNVNGTIGFWTQSTAAGRAASGTSGHEGIAGSTSAGLRATVHPNPFSSGTTLTYSIAESVHARIRLTDELGRTIRMLIDGSRDPGTYRLELGGENLPSGIYRIILDIGSDRTALDIVRVR